MTSPRRDEQRDVPALSSPPSISRIPRHYYGASSSEIQFGFTGDTAEGADASVSTIAPTDNLRLPKAPICLGLSRSPSLPSPMFGASRSTLPKAWTPPSPPSLRPPTCVPARPRYALRYRGICLVRCKPVLPKICGGRPAHLVIDVPRRVTMLGGRGSAVVSAVDDALRKGDGDPFVAKAGDDLAIDGVAHQPASPGGVDPDVDRELQGAVAK